VLGHPGLDGDHAHAVRDHVVQLAGDAQPFARHGLGRLVAAGAFEQRGAFLEELQLLPADPDGGAHPPRATQRQCRDDEVDEPGVLLIRRERDDQEQRHQPQHPRRRAQAVPGADAVDRDQQWQPEHNLRVAEHPVGGRHDGDRRQRRPRPGRTPGQRSAQHHDEDRAEDVELPVRRRGDRPRELGHRQPGHDGGQRDVPGAGVDRSSPPRPHPRTLSPRRGSPRPPTG
jgi:hypothetical protein